jgi:DNA-binding winged helix-turn-helix (wHTH) protein
MTRTAWYRFGHFELQPDERRLLAAGAPVALRPRAFDVLLALVERAGHLVTKDELLDRVWPKVIVEENTLRAQVSSLRKILSPEAIATISGQGYRFTLEVAGATRTAPAVTPKHNLPHQLTSFVGREQEIAQLEELVTAHRLCRQDAAGDRSGEPVDRRVSRRCMVGGARRAVGSASRAASRGTGACTPGAADALRDRNAQRPSCFEEAVARAG